MKNKYIALETWFISKFLGDVILKFKSYKLDKGLYKIEHDAAWPIEIAQKYYLQLNGQRYGNETLNIVNNKKETKYGAPLSDLGGFTPKDWFLSTFNHGLSFA